LIWVNPVNRGEPWHSARDERHQALRRWLGRTFIGGLPAPGIVID
jgi:hypothetical protein